MTGHLVVRDAEVDGVRVDVAVDGERITAVVPAGTARSEHTVDAGGGALIPGLHDHHIHLLALAAAATSVVCGPPAVTGYRALADELGRGRPNAGVECVATRRRVPRVGRR